MTAAYLPGVSASGPGSGPENRATFVNTTDDAPPLLDDRERYLERIDHRATVARLRALVPAAAAAFKRNEV